MGALEHIIKKYNIDTSKKSPHHIQCGRWRELPKLFNEVGFKVGAEIGILRGAYTETLCKAGFKMYGIDVWTQYPTYNDFRSQSGLDKFERDARNRLKDLDCTIIKAWSMDAVKVFDDESLDFIFIDGNHSFEFVTNDIAEWGKKVKKGGIISGHDYFRSRSGIYIHVKDVVNGWTYSHKIDPWFVLEGNKNKSWMWVKE